MSFNSFSPALPHFSEDSTEVQGEIESPAGNITSNNLTNPRPDDDELPPDQSGGSTSTNVLPSTHNKDILESLKPKRSKWTPPPGNFSALDHYIDKCRREVNQLDFKSKATRYNLTIGEQEALRRLRKLTDVVFRAADKGGAFVVWRKDLYLAEAYRQLSDGNFYQRIPEDATQENQNIVRSFVQRAIEANELPPSATNLLVEHARTSKFYLLPKIHKPGNPGRPIVSACACPTEHLPSYLDKLTAPFVRQLDSYVKDTTHMLQLLDSFQFSEDGQHRLVFTMDIKSLYTIIPNDEGLLALKHFLDKREKSENKDPPTDTLVRMAELLLTLNTFEFNGDYYKQVGGVAMGSKLGPNYACLFVGYVEEKMLAEYPSEKPELYKRFMDDVAGATSCSEQELQRFLEFASNYHPKIDYTWSVSADKFPFLDIYMIPRGNRIETSIYYKETDSHSYLDFGSSHPSKSRDIPGGILP
ncbi:uncharacterized protein LOC144661069 [Oculina patagonica]